MNESTVLSLISASSRLTAINILLRWEGELRRSFDFHPFCSPFFRINVHLVAVFLVSIFFLFCWWHLRGYIVHGGHESWGRKKGRICFAHFSSSSSSLPPSFLIFLGIDRFVWEVVPGRLRRAGEWIRVLSVVRSMLVERVAQSQHLLDILFR